MSTIESHTTPSSGAVGYFDGFVIPVSRSNLERDREQAVIASDVWREHGALDYLEAVGDDLDSEFGVPFPQLATAGDDEVVVFAWISYRDRAHRDEVNAKVMADERIKAMCTSENPDFESPFDVRRMSYGGFSVLVGG